MRQFVSLGRFAFALLALCTVAYTARPALAAPAAEDVKGIYAVSANLYTGVLVINAQSGNNFTGYFSFPGEPNTPVAGTVTGDRGGADLSTPIAISFNRTLGSGLVQMYSGAVSTYPSGPNTTKALMSGIFYHNGVGPYPWRAEK